MKYLINVMSYLINNKLISFIIAQLFKINHFFPVQIGFYLYN